MNRHFRIVNTDNFGGDYPDEYFLATLKEEMAAPLVFLIKVEAEKVACTLNGEGSNASRFWKVVDSEYQLIRGFRP